MDWKFYIIYHPCGATYAGVSPDPVQRLRKHNGEISGGAKYTLSKGSGWTHVCLVSGFPTKQNALQFEWAVKHFPPRNLGGIEARMKKLVGTMNKEYWTGNSPSSLDIPLSMEVIQPELFDISDLNLLKDPNSFFFRE
jgi:predicted GIY-YIG superfamily endonuclease